MTPPVASRSPLVASVSADRKVTPLQVELPPYDRERLDDVSFMTAMTLVLLGNYSQTGHYGGPLAYTPYNVAVHLAGPDLGGLRYDIRAPKRPLADKFMLAGGHSIPTCYALWMILYEAMRRRHAATGRDEYAIDPAVAILPIDALGFRRSPGAARTLLSDYGLEGDPLFADARLRGIRALMGHSESTDVTNDVNGGPSGIGIATSAGKAMFWDMVGGPPGLKIIAFEGEFAMTEGHAQELKTAALAQEVGKRLRIILSFNNAGIDDRLLGGVVDAGYDGYDIALQWASYGWNVLAVDDGNDMDRVVASLKAMEEWPGHDRRPMIVVARTLKGWWPTLEGRELAGFGPALLDYESHPYSLKTNSAYFVALAESYERRFGVRFEGIRDGAPGGEPERLRQFMTNIDVCLSVLDSRPGLGEWVAERLLAIAGTVDDGQALGIDARTDPFLDPRLEVDRLPTEPVEVTETHPTTGATVSRSIKLFLPAGTKAGTRRAISEVGAWLSHVTGHRFVTVAADLSESINLEAATFFGHYDPDDNPGGRRLKAGIQEAVNASTMIGLVTQNASPDPDRFAGMWGVSGTYGAFTPLMYTPARVFSQQNQDSPHRLGVLTILAGHSGPETAADARTHFGIFAPQVWTLFPRGQVVNLYFWDYNDVAPGYFAAAARAAREPSVGIIVVHVARPDFVVADRSTFADSDPRAAARGIYLIRDYDPARPPMGTVWAQGASSTVNLVKALARLDAEGINVRVGAVISPELFAWQDAAYRERILPASARLDAMVVSTMTKRIPPIHDLGPLTEEYSLYADHDDRWRTGGTEADVIAESRLDVDSIYQAVVRFARERAERLSRQRAALDAL